MVYKLYGLFGVFVFEFIGQGLCIELCCIGFFVCSPLNKGFSMTAGFNRRKQGVFSLFLNVNVHQVYKQYTNIFCSFLTNVTLHVRVMFTTVANVSLYAVQFSAVFFKLVEKSLGITVFIHLNRGICQ